GCAERDALRLRSNRLVCGVRDRVEGERVAAAAHQGGGADGEAEQREDAARGHRPENRPSADLRLSLDRVTPRVGVLTQRRRRLLLGLRAQPGLGLREGRDRPGHYVLALEELEPGVERTGTEERGQFGRECLLILFVLPLDEVGAADQLAEPLPELRLDRRDRQEPSVGGLVD